MPVGSASAAGARSAAVPASPLRQGIDEKSVTDEPSGATSMPPSGRSRPPSTRLKSSTWALDGRSARSAAAAPALSEVATPPRSAGDTTSNGVAAVANSEVLPDGSVKVALNFSPGVGSGSGSGAKLPPPVSSANTCGPVRGSPRNSSTTPSAEVPSPAATRPRGAGPRAGSGAARCRRSRPARGRSRGGRASRRRPASG